MSRTPQAVVFDLDGTLVETAADLHLVLAEILAEAGLQAPSPAAVRAMIGDGARMLVRRALAAIGHPFTPPELDRLYDRFRERYAEEPCRASRAYPGAVELLQALRAGGVRLGLCTNKPQAATLGLMAALDLLEPFSAVVGGDITAMRKPDPGHLAATLDVLGVPPRDAVMVGDSRNDLLTARGLGVPCVLVSFGYSNVDPRELGADAVIDRLGDLPAALSTLDSVMAAL